MRALLWAAMLAVADEPATTATLEFEDVWGPSCIEAIEKGLSRLEGVISAKVKGYDRVSKYFFDVTVRENKTLRPAHLEKLAKELEDYPFKAYEITAIRGTVAKDGEAYTLTAQGSKEVYVLKASEDLKKLVAAGKAGLTLGGKLTETKEKDKAVLTLEVTSASETPR